MHCPKCDRRAGVIDSREKPSGERYRRYDCACGNRFSTVEWIDDTLKKGKDMKVHLDRYNLVKTLSKSQFDIVRGIIMGIKAVEKLEKQNEK